MPHIYLTDIESFLSDKQSSLTNIQRSRLILNKMDCIVLYISKMVKVLNSFCTYVASTNTLIFREKLGMVNRMCCENY